MKHIAFLMIVIFAAPAFAQEKPAAKEEATKPEPMKEAAKPAPTAPKPDPERASARANANPSTGAAGVELCCAQAGSHRVGELAGAKLAAEVAR